VNDRLAPVHPCATSAHVGLVEDPAGVAHGDDPVECRIDIEAATMDGVAGLSILSMPTHVADRVLRQLQITAIDFGRGGQ
jgi:hypothetical protein